MSENKPPCECVTRKAGKWICHGCDCGNRNDLTEATSWAEIQNAAARERELLDEIAGLHNAIRFATSFADGQPYSHGALSNAPEDVQPLIDSIVKMKAEIERLREALKSAEPVYTTTKDKAVREGLEMSGSIKYYKIAPHIVHKARRCD